MTCWQPLENSSLTDNTIYHSTFPSRFDSLAEIAIFVRKAAYEAGLDDINVYSVETAVDEACSNIIEHALHGDRNSSIDCTCQVNYLGITVILNDHGKPFNPETIPPPNLDASLEEREDHGLGLFFINKCMDEVHFEFDPIKGNTLTMRKFKTKIK